LRRAFFVGAARLCERFLLPLTPSIPIYMTVFSSRGIMTDKPKAPILSVQAQADEAVREARRAASLRSNLQRRKAQDAAREDAPPSPPKPETTSPSLFQAEADAAVRDARREAALRAQPLHRKD
jgi:hypothetical protein